MTAFDRMLDVIGRLIAARLQAPASSYEPFTPSDPDTLRRTLRLADVLLVEGNQKIATAIKYLTQSTWSHAAIYVGTAAGAVVADGGPHFLIEANLGEGVVAVPLSKYAAFNTRICRPVELSETEQEQVVRFVLERVGQQYDTRNIVDLARYLLSTPPVPVRWRRPMLALGSGEPTRAICSTLIAQASKACAIRSCRKSGVLRPPTWPTVTAMARSCTSVTTACSHHGISIFRPTSKSSNR